MIITRSWVYLEYVSSASIGGNSKGGGDGKTKNNVVGVEEVVAAAIGNTKVAQRLLTTTFLAHAKLSSLLPSPSLLIPLLFFAAAVILGYSTVALFTTIPVPVSL